MVYPQVQGLNAPKVQQNKSRRCLIFGLIGLERLTVPHLNMNGRPRAGLSNLHHIFSLMLLKAASGPEARGRLHEVDVAIYGKIVFRR
jgi:hypothetical protein